MTIPAIRYNNPGNVSLPITGWTGGGHIVGLPDQPGYAAFPTMQAGYEAFKLRLHLFITMQGRNTIRTIGALYAADPHWPMAVSNLSGIGIDTPIDPANASQMDALAAGIIKQETGMTIAQLLAASPSPSPSPTASGGTGQTPTVRSSMPFTLPTIVQLLVALLPGIPDDIALVEAELKELASTDDGKTKLKTALVFAQTLASKIEAAIA